MRAMSGRAKVDRRAAGIWLRRMHMHAYLGSLPPLHKSAEQAGEDKHHREHASTYAPSHLPTYMYASEYACVST